MHTPVATYVTTASLAWFIGLILNKHLTNVANRASRLAKTLSNGGKGGFVYQQNTGELFCSTNGSFAGGGTQIGVITTDGAKPRTFNASSLVQV